jgi:hypothetical protein
VGHGGYSIHEEFFFAKTELFDDSIRTEFGKNQLEI